MAKTPTTRRTSSSKRSSAAGRTPRANNGRPASRHLVIVESPAKAATIGRFLGRDYTVKASMGHVRDLPKRKLGVNPDKNFTPWYEVPEDKRKVVEDIRVAGESADDVYLATDPDREGEAIAWHVLEAAGWRGKPVRRVVFHSITEDAVREAFAHERDIDMELVNAQQARRIEDRLVGFKLSPLLKPLVGQELNRNRSMLTAQALDTASAPLRRPRAVRGAAPRRGAGQGDRRLRSG